MTGKKLSPVLLEAAKVSALDSFEQEDYQGLRDTLVGLRANVEPYRNREIKTKGYFGVDFLKTEEPHLREYCRYLDICLADLSSFDPRTFEQILTDVIVTIIETDRLSKHLKREQNRERMKAARAGRTYDRGPIMKWYEELPLRRQKSSVRGLATWMLDNWDARFEGIKPPSFRTLRRALRDLKSEE